MSNEDLKTKMRIDGIVGRSNKPGSTTTGGPALPWWVELLFVQIGLPDSWLRQYLTTRKKAMLAVEENKRSIFYILITTMGVIYLNPLIKQAQIHNSCVHHAQDYVREKVEPSSTSIKSKLSAWSNRFCNGGDI